MRRKAIAQTLFFCFAFLAQACLLFAQTANPPQPLKLDAAVELALSNYPAIKTVQAQADAAKANIDLARTAYLPRLDLLYQENRATRNNVFGAVLPQSIIPGISGPVLGTESWESTFGSAGGTLFSWEPFDFGVRKAQVNVARAITNQANANIGVMELDVAANAADAFMALAANEQAVQLLPSVRGSCARALPISRAKMWRLTKLEFARWKKTKKLRRLSFNPNRKMKRRRLKPRDRCATSKLT